MGLLTAAERALLRQGRAFGLPMDHASRMARADVDFPISFYHATGSDFRHIDRAARGANSDVGAAREAFWGAGRPEMVQGYADMISRRGGSPSVMPMRGRMQNPLVIDARGGPIYDAVPERAFSAVLRDAKAAGHDGVIFKNAKDAPGNIQDAPAGDVYAFFPENAVRSRHAAFDPARREENDLLAGLALGAPVVGGGMLSAMRRRESA